MNTEIAAQTDNPTRPHVDHEIDHEMEHAARSRLRMGWGQRAIVALLLTVVIVPPLAGFYSYFSGVPLHLLAAKQDDEDKEAGSRLPPPASHSWQANPTRSMCPTRSPPRSESAKVKGFDRRRATAAHDETARAPRIHRARSHSPCPHPPRFAPARVIELAQVQDRSPATRFTEYRELRQGDRVSKGDLLGVFYSVDVGSRKNDLLDALVQLELDQKILDEAEKHMEAVPHVFMLTTERAVQGDRNAINRALNNLRLWDIPQDEIDALQAEANKISSDKNSWLKTPEGRWVNREKHAANGKAVPRKNMKTRGKSDPARPIRRRRRRTQRPHGRDGGG